MRKECRWQPSRCLRSSFVSVSCKAIRLLCNPSHRRQPQLCHPLSAAVHSTAEVSDLGFTRQAFLFPPASPSNIQLDTSTSCSTLYVGCSLVVLPREALNGWCMYPKCSSLLILSANLNCKSKRLLVQLLPKNVARKMHFSLYWVQKPTSGLQFWSLFP